MWECPICNRIFKVRNQSHSCVSQDIGRLFENKSDELVLCFDTLLNNVLAWEPNFVGVSTNTIIFTSKKAWLIIKPMTKELDLKIYYSERIEDIHIQKITPWGKKFAHHMRIRSENEIDVDLMRLLKMGYDYSTKQANYYYYFQL